MVLDERQTAVLQQLEDFFSGPKFMCAIGDFFRKHADSLDFKPLDEDQPLSNHDVYRQYVALVEGQLEAVLKAEGYSAQEVFEACAKAQQQNQQQWMTCIDFLVASTEYESFMELAFDFASMQNYDPNEDTAWDPPEEDDASEGAEPVPLDFTEEDAELLGNGGKK